MMRGAARWWVALKGFWLWLEPLRRFWGVLCGRAVGRGLLLVVGA